MADLHIRKNGIRYEEYQKVFDELYKVLEKNKDDALIVVCGDVFHEPMTTESNSLVKRLFVNMSKYCDIVVFFGNHDQASRSNSELKDSLTSALENLKTEKKVYILEKSGTYIYSNLAFGYTNIYDKNVYQITEDTGDKLKIALWHGTVNGSKTNLGQVLENSKFNCESFKDYDLGLFGDIHCYQYLDNKKKFWYCGSMIQQDHGESVNNHGILIHDLKNKTQEHIELYNENCYLTIHVKEKKVIKYDKTLIKNKKVDLKIIYEGDGLETSKKEINELTKICNIVSSEIIKKTMEDYYTNDKKEEIEITNDETMIKKIIDYMKNEELLEKEDENKTKEILIEHAKKINYLYEKEKKKIKLKVLAFNNYNLYGEENCVDFSDLSGVINVSGKNGLGKSSFIECILYVIYGLSTIKYENVNNKKKTMECMGIFEINGIEYKIIRGGAFMDNKRSPNYFENILEFYKNGVEIGEKNESMINSQITELFGKKDDFVRLYFMTQKNQTNFLDLSDKKRTEYLLKLLNLDIYEMLAKSIKDESKEKKDMITSNEKKIYVMHNNKLINQKELRTMEIETEEINLNLFKKEENNIESEYEKANKKKIINEQKILNLGNIEEIIKNKECMEKNNEKITSDMEINKKIKNELEKRKSFVDEDNDEIKTKLEKYNIEKVEKNNKKFEENKKQNIEIIEQNINELLTKKNPCEKKINLKDLENMEKEKESIEIKEKEIEKNIINDTKKIREIVKSTNEYKKIKNLKEMKEKYECMIGELKTKDDEELILNITLNNVLKKIGDSEVNIKKLKMLHEKNKISLEELDDELKNYIDIEEKKNNFDEEKNNNISKCKKQIGDLMKKYKNISLVSITKKKYDDAKKNKIEEEKEMEKYLIFKKNTLDEINKKKSEILTVAEDIIEIKENYNNFLQLEKDYVELKNKKQYEENYLTEMKKHLSMKNENHKYNKSCNVCMENQITKDVIKLEKDIELKEEELFDINTKLKKKEKKYEKNKKCVELYNVQIDIEKSNQLIKNNISNLELSLTQTSMEIEKKEILLKNIETELENYLLNIENKKINDDIDISIKDFEKKIIELEKTSYLPFDEYSVIHSKRRHLIDELNKITPIITQYDEYLNEESMLHQKIKELEKEKINISVKYEKYKNYGELNEKYENNVKEHENLKKDLRILEEQKDNIHDKKEKTLQRIVDFENNKKIISDNKIIDEQITEKRETIKKIKETVNSEYDEFKKYELLYKKNNIEIMELKIKINENKTEHDSIEKKIIDNQQKLDKLLEYNKIILETTPDNEIYNSLKDKIENIKIQIDMAKKKITTMETKRDNIIILEKESIELEKEKKILDNLETVIGEKYIDNLLSTAVFPEMTNTVNSLLAKFVDFTIKIDYDKKNIKVFKLDKSGFCGNIDKLSGGESSLTNIIFRLALHNRNKLFKSNFLVIDEGFVYCDETKIVKLEDLLKYLETIFEFVLIVTHDSTLASYTKTNSIVIFEDKGCSKILKISNKEKMKEYFSLLEKVSKKKKNTAGDIDNNIKTAEKKFIKKKKVTVVKSGSTKKKINIDSDSD